MRPTPPSRALSVLAILLPFLLIVGLAGACAWQIDRLAGAIPSDQKSSLLAIPEEAQPVLYPALALGAALGLISAVSCWHPLRRLRTAHASAVSSLEAQAERREREDLARAGETLRSHAIFMLDAQGRVASWDRDAERLLGYRADDILARHVSFLYSEDQIRRGFPLRDLTEAAGSGRCDDSRTVRRKDGFEFEASLAMVAIRDVSGGLCGFTQVVREVL